MMNVQAESTPLHKIIRRYENGVLYTQDQAYQQAIMLFKDSTYTDVLPSCFAALNQSHFEQWIALKPELILVGTGNEQIFLNPADQAFFIKHKISVETMTTPSAARTFNILVSEGRLVLGIFFLYHEI